MGTPCWIFQVAGMMQPFLLSFQSIDMMILIDAIYLVSGAVKPWN
jgi:hypothetical protein